MSKNHELNVNQTVQTYTNTYGQQGINFADE